MLLRFGLLLLVSCVFADPFDELRSNFELLEYDSNLDNPAYRLLDNVQPTNVHVDLDVYLNESRFNGVVIIDVTTSEDLKQIVLHQKVVSIINVDVRTNDSDPVALQTPSAFETDDYYEIIKINFADTIPAGKYVITITYLGQINENQFDRGFYKGYYFEGNVKRYYATTQFQPYHARKAFPCFDEPQFKSKFWISIVRDSNLSPSYSNMAIFSTDEVAEGRIRDRFLPTPIVSAYLVAFHVSDFVETNTTATATQPFSIVSRPGVTDQHAYSADIGLKITNKLSEYLDIDYYGMGQGQPMKNDHIAIPDFPSGAMENWGMVNYREAYLLYDSAHTNLINKIFMATIIAHELAHKWFGNLVTCFWWSNLWLNESYASFFEYFAAHMADEKLELADQFVVDHVHNALNYDAGAGATPMNWSSVSDNPSITSHFSVSSYAKGASVLRMLEHFVGPETFKNALRAYLKTNAYGLGTPQDMYTAFTNAVAGTTFATEYPGINVAEVFDSWVQTPGSPVLDVYVDMSGGGINVTQRRYQLTETSQTSLWKIPLTWTDSGERAFGNTKPKIVMTEKSIRIQNLEGHRWVVFNIGQSGLYRVSYDDHNWEMIASALRNNITAIPKLNRAQIVNDILYFIRSGDITINRAFDVLTFLEKETDYYVWRGALSMLDWILKRLEHIPQAHEQFVTYLLNSMEAVIEHLGYEEKESDSVSTILNRMQIMNYACNLGHKDCIEDSIKKWKAFRESNTPVPVNARRYVYCIGLREGNATDYQFLLNKYNSAQNTADMVVMLRALACTKHENSLKNYLEESLNNDKIRLHDRTNAFSFALQGNKENLKVVLNFFYTKYKEIEQKYGGTARLTVAMNQFTAFMTDFEKIVEFQKFVYENQIALGPSAFNTGKSIIQASVNNLRWANGIAAELYSEVRKRNSAVMITTPLFLMIVALATHFLA